MKFTKPLQICCCSVQKYLHRMTKLAWQLSRYLWRGWVSFKTNSRPLFTIIFKLKNDNFKSRDFSPLIKRVITGVFRYKSLNLNLGNFFVDIIWLVSLGLFKSIGKQHEYFYIHTKIFMLHVNNVFRQKVNKKFVDLWIRSLMNRKESMNILCFAAMSTTMALAKKNCKKFIDSLV